MDEFDDIIAGRGAAPEPLTDAYRVIRPLGGAEHPVTAVLAHGPDGPVALADVRDLTGWPGCGLRGQHVLAPIDVARTAGGHALVLAWCRHRITTPWAAGSLSGGQAVTLAVSMMRGALEARARERGVSEGPPGTWWADDDGRPLFAATAPGAAVGDGSRPAGPRADDAGRGGRRGSRGSSSGTAGETAALGAAAVLAVVADGMADRVVRRLLERAVALLGDPAELPRGIDEIEAELFEACAPQPLDFTDPDGSEPDDARPPARVGRRFAPAGGRAPGGAARGGGPARTVRRAARPRGRAEGRGPGRDSAAGARASAGGSIGAAAKTARRAARAVASRAGAGLSGRRAAYALGGAAAAGVLIVGLLWPSGEPRAQADEAGSVGSSEAGHADGADGERADAGGGAVAADTGGEENDGRRIGSDGSRGPDGGAPNAPDDAAGGAEEEPAADDAPGSDAGIEVEVSADPVESAARLIGRAAECGDACDGVFAAGAGAGPESAPWPELAGEGVALVDDYGGVTLVKAGTGGGAHYLSLVLSDGRWLLRDAYPAG
ncbi:hypothetical protein [Microbacterium halophytorum]|uniref:hypothetical protein n=1 Tax=Microbacterium halophytorum TaxID=2067568 RepID=UPI000CFE0645|nr:hypothetical protein [Microbacterium halophytorum]